MTTATHMKLCHGCRVQKPEADFYAGRSPCMACIRARQRQRYRRDPEPARARARARKAKDAMTDDELRKLADEVAQATHLCCRLAADVAEALKSAGRERAVSTRTEDLKTVVAKRYSVSFTSLGGRSREQEIVRPRWVAIWFCRHGLGLSLPVIGAAFGGRDHTSIMHALRGIEKLRPVDEDLDRIMRLIASDLGMDFDEIAPPVPRTMVPVAAPRPAKTTQPQRWDAPLQNGGWR